MSDDPHSRWLVERLREQQADKAAASPLMRALLAERDEPAEAEAPPDASTPNPDGR
jgi:hypothetical protein